MPPNGEQSLCVLQHTLGANFILCTARPHVTGCQEAHLSGQVSIALTVAVTRPRVRSRNVAGDTGQTFFHFIKRPVIARNKDCAAPGQHNGGKQGENDLALAGPGGPWINVSGPLSAETAAPY